MDSNKIYNKGIALLESALKKYHNGKIIDAEKDRKESNKYFDAFNQKILTNEGKNDIIYGKNRNFGIIYNIIEENAKKSYTTKEGLNHLTSLIKVIKENKILLSEFQIYDTLSKPNGIKDVENYVNEMINVTERYDTKILKENNEKIIDLIRKYHLDENIHISNDNIKLYEAIEYVITTPRSINNIDKYMEIKNTLNEHIEERNRVIIDTKSIENKINSLSEDLNNQLNDSEKELIKEMSGDDGKKKLIFERYKKDLIDLLQEKINKDENSEYTPILEKIKEKHFDSKKCIIDVAEMAGVKSVLKSKK